MPFLTILLQTPLTDPDEFNNYLLLGFGVMWFIGFVYVLYLANQRRNAERDLFIMQQLLDDEDA